MNQLYVGRDYQGMYRWSYVVIDNGAKENMKEALIDAIGPIKRKKETHSSAPKIYKHHRVRMSWILREYINVIKNPISCCFV